MAEEAQAGGAQPAEAEEQSLGLLDEIMSQTRMAPEDEGYDVAKRGVQAFISELLAPGKKARKADKTAVDSMIAEIDSKLSGQLVQILHHKTFQKMESAWRGLKTLSRSLPSWRRETSLSPPRSMPCTVIRRSLFGTSSSLRDHPTLFTGCTTISPFVPATPCCGTM